MVLFLTLKNKAQLLAAVLILGSAAAQASGTGMYCYDKTGAISVSVEMSSDGDNGSSSGLSNTDANFTLSGQGLHSNITASKDSLGVISAVAKDLNDGREINIYGYLLKLHSSSGTTWSDGMARDYTGQVLITEKDGKTEKLSGLNCSYEKLSDD